jgi:hypothetical protein
MIQSPSRTIFSSLTPSKSRSRGRRMVLRKTSGNVRQLEFISLRYRQFWLWYG